MSRCGGARKRRADESEEDYLNRRQKNNDAVHRTREKKRTEERDLFQRVEELRQNNTVLENQVETLKRELDFLKELFAQYAKNMRPKESDKSDNRKA